MRHIIHAIVVVIATIIFMNASAADGFTTINTVTGEVISTYEIVDNCQVGDNDDWTNGNARVIYVAKDATNPYHIQMKHNGMIINIETMPNASIAADICNGIPSY